MKKLLCYAILCLSISQLKAQESVNFKMKYSPDKNYTSKVSMGMNFNVTLNGDTSLINKLKSQGITQPLALNMEITMNGNTKTGSVNSNKNFPITVSFNLDQMKFALSGKDIPIPTDKLKSTTTIFGHVGPDGKLRADSIGGGKLKDTSEKAVSQLINSIQNNIKFPEHPMHVGDTFTQDIPLNIPMAGNYIEAKSKAVYKLVSIKDGNAYFDVDQSMDMTVPIKTDALTLVGTGTGKLIYNLKENFMTDYNTDMNLKFNGKISAVEISGTGSMKMDYKYTIQGK